MTTPLDHEPLPGDSTVPYMSILADRLYQRLPEVYRTMDANNSDWPLKRYLGGMLATAGAIGDTFTQIRGDFPIGPAAPAPWALSADELAIWQANRVNRPSALGDPGQADPRWLPWMAQLVGAPLDPGASVQEQRDTIAFATSGWRGGTRQAIADAARTALTGSMYAQVVPHVVPSDNGGLDTGGVWDITIITRSSETPDPGAVLDAVLRKGVKPAGAVLHHATYGASWAQIEAVYPTWADWNAATWAQIEQAGLAYAVNPSNLLTSNPSFETDATGWTALADSSVARVLGGVDGLGMGRIAASASGTIGATSPEASITSGNARVSLSIRPTAARDAELVTEFRDSGHAALSSVTDSFTAVPAGQWMRLDGLHAVPASTAYARITIRLLSMASGEHFDIDAVDIRRTT
jgi:hypothetical protein